MTLYAYVKQMVEEDPTMQAKDIANDLKPLFPDVNPTWFRNRVGKDVCCVKRRMKARVK